MEKLIELLNEYEKDISLWSEADWREFDWNLHYYCNYKDEYVFDNVYYRIISKNFWFIKWLVDNDKIDLDKLEKKVLKENLIRKFDEWLLMLLSIQEKPIDFLISILK